MSAVFIMHTYDIVFLVSAEVVLPDLGLYNMDREDRGKRRPKWPMIPISRSRD